MKKLLSIALFFSQPLFGMESNKAPRKQMNHKRACEYLKELSREVHKKNKVEVTLAAELMGRLNEIEAEFEVQIEVKDECSFCLKKLDPIAGNVVKVGENCTHVLHTHCLAKIKEKFNTCPLCRASLNSSGCAEEVGI